MHGERLNRRVNRLERLISKATLRLQKAQNLRLATGLLFFAGLVLSTLLQSVRLEGPVILAFLIVFPILVWRTRRIQRFVHLLTALKDFDQRQLLRQQGRPSGRERALPALEGESAVLAGDLALTGPHSVFGLIDETVTDGGRRELLQWILHSLPSREAVFARQKLIQNLAHERWPILRALFEATGDEQELSTFAILDFLKRPFLDSSFQRFFVAVVAIWFFALATIVWEMVGTSPVSPAWSVTIFIAASFLGLNRIGPVFHRGVGFAQNLSRLTPLFGRLESRTSPAWKEALPETLKTRPTRLLSGVQSTVNFLSIEANPLVYFLINAVTPWTFFFTWRLNRQKEKLGEALPICLHEFNRFEALSSLVFLYADQTQTFPTLAERPTLSFKGLYHPLIEREHVVDNDFDFKPGAHLGLITGSNMAGKSTFLRAVGINQILANMGAPVFAQSLSTWLCRVESCIQVTDSLRDGVSYFYAEVLRLKRLIEDVATGEPILFLVDEIFRGTNNRERHIGSRAVIRALSGPGSLGFVSTHDLELTQLGDTETAIENLHFRDEVQGGEMVFTYKLHHGPCPTTNALRIMRRMGLPVSEA